ncbi:MAG: GNAT family N-acetyltransferase [Nitriliruptorales bacterium]|nr:GNAT family N-acetyltransferase [Nitriliruptorales bacterium]
MSRCVVPLDGSALDQLPASCRRCLFWELGTPRPDPREPSPRTGDPADDPATRKRAWCRSETIEHAPPGRVVTIDGAFAGYALFGPADHFAPRRLPAPALSHDALLLATIWVDPRHRDGGVGRLLLQAALKEAIRLDLAAVETYGDRRFREQTCVLPSTWLFREGFTVHREHPRSPLLRLETRRTVRWADALEHAWDEVTGRLPKLAPQPAPAPRPRAERGAGG